VQMSVFHRFLVHARVHVYKHAHTTHLSTVRYSMSHAAMYTWIASLVEAGSKLSF
jgi:hypothetical protein